MAGAVTRRLSFVSIIGRLSPVVTDKEAPTSESAYRSSENMLFRL